MFLITENIMKRPVFNTAVLLRVKCDVQFIKKKVVI